MMTVLGRRWLAFLALVLCWVPVLGAILGLVAWRKNRRATAGVKLVSLLAMILAVALTLLFIVLYVMQVIEGERSLQDNP
jgi:uncharacterized membrane protein